MALGIEWQERLDKGKAVSRADLAYKMEVTRAHVTQVLSLLDLAFRYERIDSHFR